VLAGWLLAGGRLQDQRLLWLLLGGSLLYSGGMILNDAADAGCDREHRKERPIPRGAVSVGAAWGGGLLLLVLGFGCCVPLGGASAPVTSALIAAILAYDFYHKPWAGSVVIMGACRTLLYWVAASALMGTRITVDALFVVPALAIGAYIVGLTMAARMEGNRGAPVSPMVAWMSKALLWAPGIVAAAWVFQGGNALMLVLVAGFAVLIAMASRMMRRGGPEIGRAVGWLLAGIALVDALAVARVSFGLACVLAACVPLLRLWQRKIAAT
jgi:4-hydroxybenzoate polyprenyltransferase